MNPMQILNQVLAGKKINIQFESIKQREMFRQRVYKLKARQDKYMAEILDEEKLIMKSKSEDKVWGDENSYFLTLWTEEKKAPTYKVLSIIEGDKASNDGQESAQEIPGNLVSPDERKDRDQTTNPDSEQDTI